MSSPVEGIRKVGFRRWYERQLIRSHAWLAACFLAMVLVAAGFELLTLERGFADFMFDATLIAGGGMFGWFAWRRYACIMVVAESIGEQAICPSCAHYGFRCEDSPRARPAIAARCPKCDHRWPIEAEPRRP